MGAGYYRAPAATPRAGLSAGHISHG
jgi:hypothetical protein